MKGENVKWLAIKRIVAIEVGPKTSVKTRKKIKVITTEKMTSEKSSTRKEASSIKKRPIKRSTNSSYNSTIIVGRLKFKIISKFKMY